MMIEMNEAELSTVSRLRAFLEGTTEVRFEQAGSDGGRYAFVQAVRRRFRYALLTRADKGVILRYLERASVYSRAQACWCSFSARISVWIRFRLPV